MRIATIVLAVLAQISSGESIVAPTIEHHKSEQVITNDNITRTCPNGYVGHFVDQHEGFDSQFPSMVWPGGGDLVYAVCFKKEFMDKLSKTPDALMVKPVLRPM